MIIFGSLYNAITAWTNINVYKWKQILKSLGDVWYTSIGLVTRYLKGLDYTLADISSKCHVNLMSAFILHIIYKILALIFSKTLA